MYAVVRTGGKQYRVTVGDILEVEKLDGAVGDTVNLDDVLLVSNGDSVTIGQPTVANASVAARITGQHRGKKILVFRYRPKKRIRVRRGHRQYLTRLEVQAININGETYTERPATTAPAVAEEPVEAEVDDVMVEPEDDETPVSALDQEFDVEDDSANSVAVDDAVSEADDTADAESEEKKEE